MKNYLNLIDTDTPGPRCDVTPLFADPAAFTALIRDLTQPFEGIDFNYVAGIDALGFILGTAVAIHFGKGFIPIRKGGKLPVPVISHKFTDYTGLQKTLELRTDILELENRVLLVDEWIETGAQITTAIDLLESQGADVIGITTINMDENPKTRGLREAYTCHTIWTVV